MYDSLNRAAIAAMDILIQGFVDELPYFLEETETGFQVSGSQGNGQIAPLFRLVWTRAGYSVQSDSNPEYCMPTHALMRLLSLIPKKYRKSLTDDVWGHDPIFTTRQRIVLEDYFPHWLNRPNDK